jgi:hypothetical protein
MYVSHLFHQASHGTTILLGIDIQLAFVDKRSIMMHIVNLTYQGINVQDILKLKAAGIVTILGVAQTPRKNLLKLKVSCREDYN